MLSNLALCVISFQDTIMGHNIWRPFESLSAYRMSPNERFASRNDYLDPNASAAWITEKKSRQISPFLRKDVDVHRVFIARTTRTWAGPLIRSRVECTQAFTTKVTTIFKRKVSSSKSQLRSTAFIELPQHCPVASFWHHAVVIFLLKFAS